MHDQGFLTTKNFMFFNLPSKKRQFFIISVAIVGYLAIVMSGGLLLDDLDSITKKKLTQAGLVCLYFAALLAGLPFVWAAKARHNIIVANSIIESRSALKTTLENLPAEEHGNYAEQIRAAELDIAHSEAQIKLANTELPEFYEWSGAFSLILVFLGTLVCIIGAG